MKPILSILVATRNRVPYCINLIETILSFDYDNFELVIQDNSDTMELYEFANTITNDIRFVYNYTPPPFSSIDNFNAVIGLAKGEYLCIIGDDDGVTHEIFNLVEWMKKNSIDAVNPKLNAMFRWPDACDLLDGFLGHKGNLEIFGFKGKIKTYRTDRQLNKLLKNGGQNFLETNLPKPYHGIVRKKYFDIIKNETNFFVGGLSPDIYMAVSLSKYIKQVFVIDYPITLPGVCYQALTRSHIDKIEKIEDAPHMRNRFNYQWAKQVPNFYSPDTIWADSMVAALSDLRMKNEIKKFNFSYLHLHLLKKFPNKKEELNKHFDTFLSFPLDSGIAFRIYFFYVSAKLFMKKLINKSKRSFFSNNKYILVKDSFKGVENIKEAISRLDSKIKDNETSFNKIIK